MFFLFLVEPITVLSFRISTRVLWSVDEKASRQFRRGPGACELHHGGDGLCMAGGVPSVGLSRPPGGGPVYPLNPRSIASSGKSFSAPRVQDK